jgi:hypothetical protein
MTVAAEQRRRSEAIAAVGRNLRRVRVPVVGDVVIPPPDRVAYYAGMGVLAAVGLIEWPLAVVVAAGHVLADQQVFSRLRGLGEAAESA